RRRPTASRGRAAGRPHRRRRSSRRRPGGRGHRGACVLMAAGGWPRFESGHWLSDGGAATASPSCGRSWRARDACESERERRRPPPPRRRQLRACRR
ncbi:hypothetical protein EMIHUDRAFT_353550, partial [Emiliania huxleyi CCMP1516]|uniref:Uncharacterized protein n=2 Tax=Emiliania huxleyi TaxID=2903 RepID=A0A0D3JVZ3_EMIH1